MLYIARSLRWVVSHSETWYRLLFVPGPEATRWQIGKWKAWLVYDQARSSTPAYASFLANHGVAEVPIRGFDPDLTAIPPMDKANYVKKYSIEDRCAGGALPPRGVVIDESSGTSGTPNNWVRGPHERADAEKMIRLSLHAAIGGKPIFLINAFALGPWATGMNVSMSLVGVSVLKSTGPDVAKILNTLKLFGPKYDYVIMGYPPFLKTLVDSTDVDWRQFHITAIYGGEGLSEGLRDHLLQSFDKVYGSYGASDLEINIGAENDFTINLRRMLAENKKLADRILRDYNGVLPMVFQYNPLDYYIETSADGELLVTLCRAGNIAPKVRYNIHDLGHVMRMPEFKSILRDLDISLETIGEPTSDLPLLFHYGRADAAVSFYGCKITPMEIQQIVLADPVYNEHVNTFSLVTHEDAQHNKHLVLALELKEGVDEGRGRAADWRDAIFARLAEVNQDYREASKMVPPDCRAELRLYPFGTGIFTGRDIRLKQQYIVEEPSSLGVPFAHST